MTILYIDESGDRGYDTGTSYFVYAGVLVPDESYCQEHLEKIKTKYEEKFGRPFRKDEIKFSNMRDKDRTFFINEIIQMDFTIFCITLKTENPFPPIKEAFNSDIITRTEMLLRLLDGCYMAIRKPIEGIIIDKSGGHEKINEFLKETTKEISKLNKIKEPKIEFQSSKNSAGIQIADVMAWVIRDANQKGICVDKRIREKIVLDSGYAEEGRGNWKGRPAVIYVIDTINKKIA